MSFTIGTAISRLGSGSVNYFKAKATDAQKLARVNECLEKLWNYGMWDGLLQEVTLASSGGIITLPPQYRKLVALNIPAQRATVSIKSQQWKFTPSAPSIGDWNNYRGSWLAFDLGDASLVPLGAVVPDNSGGFYSITVNSGVLGVTPFVGTPPETATSQQVVEDGNAPGVYWQVVVQDGVLGIQPAPSYVSTLASARQYQIAGDPATSDAQVFKGMAKLRYIWATDVNQFVVPDNYPALLDCVQSFYWRDAGDTTRSEKLFASALLSLEKDLEGILEEEDLGRVTIDPLMGMGGIPNLM